MDQNTTFNPNTNPQPTSAWYKKPIALVIFVILLALSIGGGLLVNKNLSKSGGAPSLKLYYRDGKTLLWQNGQPTDKNTGFISYIQEQLKTKYGTNFAQDGEWKITTTLDQKLQTVAIEQIDKKTTALNLLNMKQSAFVAQDATNGQVLSWVDNILGNYEAAVRAKTMVGTLQLPFTYAAFMTKTNQGTDTILDDVQGKITGYPCTNRAVPNSSNGGNCLFNSDLRYLGPISLKQALAGGRLVPAAKAATQTDGSNIAAQSKVTDTTRKMGADAQCYIDKQLTEKTPCYISSAFGEGVFATPLSMTQAYATLANTGAQSVQATILAASLNGEVRQSWRELKPTPTISKTNAQALTDALSDPNLTYLTKKDAFTTPKGTKLTVVGGHTNDDSVTSTVQYSSKYVVGFWALRDGETTALHDGTPSSVLEATLLPVTSSWMAQTE